MNEEYIIIHKSILPEYFDAVIKAKSLVDDGELSVCDACRQTGISRSTFYKYKDNIFSPPKNYGKKAIVAIKTCDERGVLSNILAIVYNAGANVITINQDMPIKDSAYITIALDVSNINEELVELVKKVKAVEYVKSASIIAVE